MSPSSAAGKEIAWQAAHHGEGWYQLEIDGVEWVRFRREPGRGSLATVEAKNGQWTIKRVGCFHTFLSIRRKGEQGNSAVFTPTVAGVGRLELRDGRVYHWLPTRSPASEWGFSGQNGELLIRVRGTQLHCWTLVNSAAWSEEDSPLLAALGFYLIQMFAADTALMTGALIAALTTV